MLLNIFSRVEAATKLSPNMAEALKKIVFKAIDGSELITEVEGKYFSFLLPKAQSNHFGALLKLIKSYNKLVSRFSIRSTSLDEVFLKIGKEAEGEATDLNLKGLAKRIVRERLSRRVHEEARKKIRSDIRRYKQQLRMRPLRRVRARSPAATILARALDDVSSIEDEYEIASYKTWSIFKKLTTVSIIVY